jgi:RNA polymerase sigma-70 factor (ECF subfamily)
MSSQQDIQLLRRLKEGDLRAFEELYLKYYKLLCTSAYFFLKSGQESKDLVQTLFLDIWDRQLYMHFHEDIKGYLFLSIKHRCLNHLKKQKTKYKEEKSYITWRDDAGLSVAEGSPDYQHQLQKALDNMPGQKRTAIQMVYLNGKRYQDAADTMKISINSLKTHLKTGLKILRGEINSKMN